MFGLSFLKGVAIGATSLYFLDPIAGPRRRSLMRDQGVAMQHSVVRFLDRGWRDLFNRSQGLLAEARSQVFPGSPPDNRQLEERVRSTMGRFVSHPRAVHVQAHNGTVLLSGSILADEVDPFLEAIRSVRGVQQVANELDVRILPDAPALEGQGRHASQRLGLSNQSYPPGVRFLGVAAGAALVGGCLLRQRPFALLAGCVGYGLLVSNLTRSDRARAVEPFDSEFSGPETPWGDHAPSLDAPGEL